MPAQDDSRVASKARASTDEAVRWTALQNRACERAVSKGALLRWQSAVNVF